MGFARVFSAPQLVRDVVNAVAPYCNGNAHQWLAYRFRFVPELLAQIERPPRSAISYTGSGNFSLPPEILLRPLRGCRSF